MKKSIKKYKATFTTIEAAEYMGMSKSAIDKSRLSVELFGVEAPEFIRYGRSVRYPVECLDAWLAKIPRQRVLNDEVAA